MEKMIAYCGLVCTECPAYIATEANDRKRLEELAVEWSKEFKTELTADGCMCDGCLTTTGHKIGYCAQCKVRACAIDKHLSNCAHCGDYACDTLTEFFGVATEAKKTLEQIRQTL